MTMTLASGLGAALAATIVTVASPPSAPNRIWVSGKGADAAGCGVPTQPCRSFQYAHDAVAAGGEIDVLDPAGYGPVSITKPISIVNDGVGLAGVQQTASGGNGVAISGGSINKVYLRGLTIDGANQGDTGVFIFPDSSATVTIENCVIKNFTGYGVWLDSTKFLIANSTIINNQTGMFARSNFSGVIKSSTIAGGTVGLSAGSTYYLSSSFAVINIFNATIFNNSATGIYSEAASTRLNIFDTGITANGTGLKTNVSAGVNLSRVDISSNQTGINTTNGAAVASYGDNVLSGNIASDWNVAPTVTAHN